MTAFGKINWLTAVRSLVYLVSLVVLFGQVFKSLVVTTTETVVVGNDAPLVRTGTGLRESPPRALLNARVVPAPVYPLEEPASTLPYWDLWKTLQGNTSSSSNSGKKKKPIMSLTGRKDWTRIYAHFDRPEGWDEFPCINRVVRALPVSQTTSQAAGPKLCSLVLDPPYRQADQRCVASEDQLDVNHLLAQGQAIKFYLDDPMSEEDIRNVVVDRERKASASGVVIMDAQHIAVVSFSKRLVYVYQFDFESRKAILLDKLLNVIRTNGIGDVIDLIDYDGKNLLATSNLHSASSTIFNFDWETKKLSLVQGVYAYADLTEPQLSHGVRFYPSSKHGSSIIALTAQLKLSPNTLGVRLFDWKKNTTQAELLMKTTPYRRYGVQDVDFIDKYNMLVALTANFISPALKEREYCRGLRDFNTAVFSSKIVHYRLHFDLDDDGLETNLPFDSDHFEELQSIDYPHGYPDSISYKDGVLISSDQLNDHVIFTAVDPSGHKNMTHLGILTGFHMNHGVTIAPNFDFFAVASYGDNSVTVSRFPAWLEKKFEDHRVSL